MIDRRHLIRLALATVAMMGVSSVAPPVSHAQQSFQQYIPLLIDLPGWTGNKPDGIAMQMSGQSMLTAAREYERGEARFAVQITTGPAAQGALAATSTGMKIETKDGHMITSTIDGLQVTRTFTISDKSGAILVALGPSAMLSATFNGIDEDEALALASKFNWKTVKAAVVK
jgi:hypothetical protein